jgi:hypothetical protein
MIAYININMKEFKLWIEDRDREEIKTTILALLGLDEEGLSVTLDAVNADKLRELQNLGRWTPDQQISIRNLAKEGDKTVGDLIERLSTSQPEIGITPPEEQI